MGTGHHDPAQLTSWFDRYGSKRYASEGLIAQIFFPTDRAELDLQDRHVLDLLVEHYSPLIGERSVELRFVGHADHRGTESHNLGLGARRAHAVQVYVDPKLLASARHHALRGRNLYSSRVKSLGEAGSHELAPDRRVDVFASFVSKPPVVVLEGSVVNGMYVGKLSNRFEFQTLFGVGLSAEIVGAQSFVFRVRNSRTERTWTYAYAGGGAAAGFKVSLNRPTGWDEKTLPDGLWMDVDAFEGPGRVFSLGGGVRTGTVMVFDGPRLKGLTHAPVALTFDTWFDLVLGAEADPMGYFKMVNR